jgi:hypothetical protein
MSLAHCWLVVMVVYLCFLTRLLAVVLLPLVEALLLEVALLPVVVQLPQALPVEALVVVLVQVQ